MKILYYAKMKLREWLIYMGLIKDPTPIVPYWMHKHSCGCITYDEIGIVYFEKICREHKENRKYLWVGLQHPEGK